MKVTCPYCNCHYDIRPEILKEPIGNAKLGFGWWLRCYKCQKKFWLSNTKVMQLTATPIKANRKRQIKNVSKLNIILKKSKNKKFYIISSIVVVLSLFSYYERDIFKNLIVNRISNITKSTITSLQLANISYRLETVDNINKIYITGFILNNTATIIPINGLKVVIYSNGKEMTSWQINPDAKNAIPGDKIFFSSEKVIERIYPNIQANAFANMINHNVGKKCFIVDTVDYENNNNKVIFRGIKTVESCKYIGLEGLNNFKPDIVFNCGNNKVKFTKIVGNNINSFKFISKNPIKIKNWISVDTTNNKVKVYNTKNKPIIGSIAVTPPYSYFELSMKTE